MIENTNNTESSPPENGVTTTSSGSKDCDSSRRNSGSSQLSSSTTSRNYDSGNVSDLNAFLCPASLSSAEDDSMSTDYGQLEKFQHLLREKDQSLFLALQDVRKLKSELERLSKSEKWYKSELRTQKNSRLEILEKLYTNERKFTQETQRLQSECVALYARCSDLENQLHDEKEVAKKILKNEAKHAAVAATDGVSRDFELEQHRQKVADQEHLIEMLRNQKKGLLNELQVLSSEKDACVLEMQKNLAQLEDENRTITRRCMQLVEEKMTIKSELSKKEADRNGLDNEVLDLKIALRGLEQKLQEQVIDLNEKENEINSLRQDVEKRDQLIHVAKLFHEQQLCELDKKNDAATNALEMRSAKAEELKASFAEQQVELENQRILLQTRHSEIEELRRNLQQLVASKKDLEQEIQSHASLREERETLYQQNIVLQQQLDAMKSKSSQSLELESSSKPRHELEQVSEKYLEVCKLYEKSNFDLDMKDIEIERFKFEKEKDLRELKSLRAELLEVSRKFECQKSLASEFELALSKALQEKRQLQTENKCNMEENLGLRAELNQSVGQLNHKDLEVESLRQQLSKVEDMLSELKMNSRDVSALLIEKESREGRVDLIQRLISLQGEKVEQLNAEQIEWENLLSLVKSADQAPDDVSSSEFENLNHLYEEQNEELMMLNASMHQQSISLTQAISEVERENKTFQEELERAKLKVSNLENQVEALEGATVDYQKEIAHLAGTNERLIQEFNEDFSREREKHNRQTKQLQLEVKFCTAENEELRESIQALQSEVERLSERPVMITDIDDNNDDKSILDESKARILQNVLETEYQRKMSRYDVHIRSLLSNIKAYKRDLEAAENRYTTLLAKSKDMGKVDEVARMEGELEHMRIQLEGSQTEINDLKNQLSTLRGSLNTIDTTNMMDDYKKLIHQSQIDTNRRSTSEIYELINKSNNFVPKLTNISASVEVLREDIQKVCTAMSEAVPAGRGAGSSPRKLSLMDELRLAQDG